jgi:hypothetical protein
MGDPNAGHGCRDGGFASRSADFTRSRRVRLMSAAEHSDHGIRVHDSRRTMARDFAYDRARRFIVSQAKE